MRRPARLILCAQIACFAVAVPLLSRLSLPQLGSLLGRRRWAGAPDPDRIEDIIVSASTVLRYGAPLIRPTCMTRGLILYHFLRRAGLDVALCFGAGYPHGEFAAHCWLMHAGQPFMEQGDPHAWFTELYRLSGDEFNAEPRLGARRG
jgi:hypothetical protein